MVAERRSRIDTPMRLQLLEFVRGLPVIVVTLASPLVFDDVAQLAQHHQLSAYDASYLYLALREGLPIATLDD